MQCPVNGTTVTLGATTCVHQPLTLAIDALGASSRSANLPVCESRVKQPGVAVDSTLLAYGYGVCRHAARTGDTWPEIERNAREAIGEDPRDDGPRSRLILIRAARENICG